MTELLPTSWCCLLPRYMAFTAAEVEELYVDRVPEFAAFGAEAPDMCWAYSWTSKAARSQYSW